MSRKRKDEGGATGEGGSDARTAGDGGSDARTAGEGAEGGAEGERLRSDLEQGLESLGKVLTGVAGRLLGPKAVGKEALGPEPTLSPEADELIEKAGEVAGRYLHATGEALKEHPLAPGKALDAARGHLDDPLAPPPGSAPLVEGLKTLGSGLEKVAEGLLDQVAPRKPRPHDDDSQGAAADPEDDAPR